MFEPARKTRNLPSRRVLQVISRACLPAHKNDSRNFKNRRANKSFGKQLKKNCVVK